MLSNMIAETEAPSVKTARLRRRLTEKKFSFRRADHKSVPERMEFFLAKRRGILHDEKMLAPIIREQNDQLLADLCAEHDISVEEPVAVSDTIVLDEATAIVRTNGAACMVELAPVKDDDTGEVEETALAESAAVAAANERSKRLARQRSRDLARLRRCFPTSPTLLQWRREERERSEAAEALAEVRLSAEQSAQITFLLRMEFGAQLTQLKQRDAERLVRSISVATSYVDDTTRTGPSCTVAAVLAAKLRHAA